VAKQPTTRIEENLAIYTDVMRQLDINYVDTLNYDKLLSTSINAMLQQVDPYTVYMPKSEADNLRMMTQGKYGGIGAVIL
jgi:carboxyl-terminal processing protease